METTVLHLAAMHGNDAMVDRVATQYPDLQFSGNVNGDTPLHVAARAGHISTLRKLLDACAYSDVTRLSELVEMKNKQRNIVLHEAMMSGGSMASMIFHVLEAFQEWLSESCYELALNNVNNQGQSVLYLAVEAGLREAVNRILDNCPGSAMPKGKSPLVAAIIKPEKGMVSIIIRKKQEWMHLGDKNGRLPLHFASSIGYYEGVVHLLEHCNTCSIERDKYGSFPLHLAALGGHVKVVKELLRYCPDPNEMVDQELRNILHVAAQSGKLDVVRYILRTPALEKMINQRDKFGRTPLHVATLWNHLRIMYALTWDDRVDVHAVDGENRTALDIAHEGLPVPSPFKRKLMLVALKSASAKNGTRCFSFESSGRLPAKPTEKVIPEKLKQKEKALSSRVDSLSLISTLIVTASVAACLPVPGDAQGTTHNLYNAMLHFFILCTTISFFSSIGATIILLGLKLRSSRELYNSTFELAMPLIGYAFITLSLAFLAGVYTVISKLTWLATTFLVITAIFVLILFVLLTIFCLPKSSTKKIWRYISYYPFIFMAWMVEKKKL